MAELRKVYWDSCVWIALIQGEQHRLRAIEYIYNSARSGAYEIWTSTLTHVEVFRAKGELPGGKPYSQEGLDQIEQMFEQDFIKRVPVDVEIAKIGRRLIREHAGLKKPQDAIHLASAIRWSIDTVHTYDGNDLLHMDGKLMTKSGTVLRIKPPDQPPDGPLFQERSETSQSSPLTEKDS